jgi:hypothetical protein
MLTCLCRSRNQQIDVSCSPLVAVGRQSISADQQVVSALIPKRAQQQLEVVERGRATELWFGHGLCLRC